MLPWATWSFPWSTMSLGIKSICAWCFGTISHFLYLWPVFSPICIYSSFLFTVLSFSIIPLLYIWLNPGFWYLCNAVIHYFSYESLPIYHIFAHMTAFLSLALRIVLGWGKNDTEEASQFSMLLQWWIRNVLNRRLGGKACPCCQRLHIIPHQIHLQLNKTSNVRCLFDTVTIVEAFVKVLTSFLLNDLVQSQSLVSDVCFILRPGLVWSAPVGEIPTPVTSW